MNTEKPQLRRINGTLLVILMVLVCIAFPPAIPFAFILFCIYGLVIWLLMPFFMIAHIRRRRQERRRSKP